MSKHVGVEVYHKWCSKECVCWITYWLSEHAWYEERYVTRTYQNLLVAKQP